MLILLSFQEIEPYFAYSYYIKSELGFYQDVLWMLMIHSKAEKCISYKEERSYCGILFDEVKAKEDFTTNILVWTYRKLQSWLYWQYFYENAVLSC
jgi:hypothetical protein